MKKIILFVLLVFVCAIAYASDISLEPLMNRVFDSSDNTIKATISGVATLSSISGDQAHLRTISSDTGVITLGGTAGSNNENLTLDFETTSNRVTLGSGTGALVIEFGNMWIAMNDNKNLVWGDNFNVYSAWKTTGNDNFQIGINVGSATNAGYFSFLEKDDIGLSSRSPLSLASNPTVRIYSVDDTVSADYIEVYHDQSNAIIASGGGAISLDAVVATGSVAFTLDAGASSDVVQVIRNDDTNSGATLNIGNGYLWVSASNKLRFHTTAPVSDDDGEVVGGQS